MASRGRRWEACGWAPPSSVVMGGLSTPKGPRFHWLPPGGLQPEWIRLRTTPASDPVILLLCCSPLPPFYHRPRYNPKSWPAGCPYAYLFILGDRGSVRPTPAVACAELRREEVSPNLGRGERGADLVQPRPTPEPCRSPTTGAQLQP